jgi:Zn ribbon nucleic-acid-binding protein
MSSLPSQDKQRDAEVVCPRCHAEMHPLFLYEDREPDTWLCFSCGHVEWINPGQGRAIPPVDE